MLILLPASDAKATVEHGGPFDPDGLSFPALQTTRRAVLDGLVEVSAERDPLHRLSESAGALEQIRRNLTILDAPAAPVEQVYAGVLYDALRLDDLDPVVRSRARNWVVVISALWGALRPGDRIPGYRLNMCGRLPGLGHMPDVWRSPLNDVLPDAAGDGVIVDCRSAEYATAWRPNGGLAERTVVVKVVRDQAMGRGAASHPAKFTRGLVVRRILVDGLDPAGPEELAGALGKHFDVDLRPSARPGSSPELRIAATTA